MKNVTTRLLLTCAAIGAAGGVLLIAVTNIAAATSHAIPLLYAAMTGIWLIPFVIVLALLRRPGVAVLAALIAGLVESPFTPYGFSSVLTCLMIGVALEIPFAVGLYRHWRPWLFFVGAGVFELLYAFTAMRSFGVETWAAWAQVLFVALCIVSGLAFTWVGLVIARRVEKTGVTRGLAPAVGAAPARQEP